MNWIVAALMVLGAFFAFVAALGVNRLPDFYMRMHAATKAGAFGATLLLIAASLYFGSLRTSIISILVIVFFYLTTPTAAQSIARAAYRKNISMWTPATEKDELERAKAQNESAAS